MSQLNHRLPTIKDYKCPVSTDNIRFLDEFLKFLRQHLDEPELQAQDVMHEIITSYRKSSFLLMREYRDKDKNKVEPEPVVETKPPQRARVDIQASIAEQKKRREQSSSDNQTA